MKNILHLISSPRGEESLSVKLGREIVSQLQEKYPDSTVKEIDLLQTNVPHLNSGHIRSFFTPPEHLTAEDRVDIEYSDRAIAQLMDADIIVIGAPLYNFGITSTLKAWIDHIARAGKTFSYSEKGAEGLVKGKKVYLAMSSGAVYTQEPWSAYDFVVPYLKAMLGFLGMTDLTVYRIEGTNIPVVKEHAVENGLQSVDIQ